jgi:D-alanyl-D-alanine carboxypeptidase (penicillin-binding protein 5/6)
MTQTTFAGDAGGLLPETVSTAHDAVLLGQAALDEAVLREIVNQESAVLPLVGTISNVNTFLGRGGINGIKTGHTDQAGGCYLFSATRQLASGQTVTSVGAIIASRSLDQAMAAAGPLLDSFYKGFANVVVVPKGTVVGRYTPAWDPSPITAVTAQDTTVLTWRGTKASIKVQLKPLSAPQPAGITVGALLTQTKYAQTSTPIITASSLAPPTWFWRITRH